MAYLRCSYCGTFVDEQFQVCPQCGSRLTDDRPKKKRGGAAIVWIVILVFLAAVGFFGLRAYRAYQEQAYEEKLGTAVYEIAMSAIDTEEAGNLLHSVWYNCIFQVKDPETDKYTRRNGGTGSFYEDFNDAIDVLYADPDYSAKMEGIMDSQYDLAQLMRELSDPPEKYKRDYEDLRTLYTAYVEFANIVTNPQGNLQSFTDKFNAADEKVVNCFYPLSMYVNG